MTHSDRTLRLIWPEWQGAGSDVVADLVPELPLEKARRGYVVGTTVLEAILPAHEGPTAHVAVSLDDDGLATRDGIQAKDAVIAQVTSAVEAIAAENPARIVTVGGDCAVSTVPFTALAAKYDDLAIVWLDSHPDVGTPASEYDGHHAMAVSLITGHGDPEILALLPAAVPPERVALAGLHAWTEDDIPRVAEWGITSFGPDDLRPTTEALLRWLRDVGSAHVAVHLDVDVIDSDEVTLGLGAEAGGLRIDDVRRILHDLSAVADIVGFTVAEYVPRQVMQLQRLLRDAPLL